MKKLILTVAAMVVVFTAGAASKLSPNTRVFLRHHERTTVEKTDGSSRTVTDRGLMTKTYQHNGVETVDAFITLDGTKSIAEMEAMGVVVESQFGDIVAVSIPVDKIEAVSELASVKRVSVSRKLRLNNDAARAAVNVEKAQAGTDLKQLFKGKDVIVGVIDTGIDYNHINFKDDNGNSRVKMVFDGKNIYTDATAIAALTTDNISESHGTHSTGTAAGSFSANGYQGMAPEADLVLCGLGDDFSSVKLANSCKTIFDYAESVGKPAVINMSLGEHGGPHDGSSELTKIFDSLEGSGRLMVLAAGNEGADKLYINKTFNQASDDVQFKTIIESSGYGGDYYNSVFSLWNRNSNPVSMQVVVLDSSNSVLATSEKFSPSKTGSEWNLSETSSASTFGEYYEGDIYAAGELVDNGKFQLYIQLEMNSRGRVGQYHLGFLIYGTNGDVIDLWDTEGYTDFINNGDASFTEGDSSCSITNTATGFKTISVGAYGSKKYFTSLDGRPYSYPNCIVGDIAYFSSYGVDMNGISHPDVCAPGYCLTSSVNSYDASTVGSLSGLQAKYTTDGKTYYWGNMSGTSMATPAVSGIVALWLEAKPTLNAEEVKALLKETSIKDSFVQAGNAVKWGAGKIDAYAGLKALLTNGVNDVTVKQNNVIVYPNPNNGEFKVYAQGETSGLTLNVYNMNGSLVYTSTYDTADGSIDVNMEGILTSGIYVVQVKGKNVNHSSRMIIK